jgi:5'-3' exonuclease
MRIFMAGSILPRPAPADERIVLAVDVHLVDGTYELFRYFLSPAAAFDRRGPEELRAVRGVVASILGMLEGGATHLGVATDHVIESFRNALWPGYKTGEGIDPALRAQFEPLEEALSALGVVVWPMVEFEADDALASAAAVASADPRVDQVVICTPDKDLAQCVRGERVVQLDRRRREVRDEAGVVRKFGVSPASIPDWLALVGDSADGYPGLPGWGAASAAAVLARHEHLEHIPPGAADWDVPVRGAARLAATLAEQRERALLFRTLATLRLDAPIGGGVDALRWAGPRPGFAAWSERLGPPSLQDRAKKLGEARAVSPARTR